MDNLYIFVNIIHITSQAEQKENKEILRMEKNRNFSFDTEFGAITLIFSIDIIFKRGEANKWNK